jgi:hypothetical protein
MPTPSQPSPVKREEEPSEELADILRKPSKPRKGRSDRGGTRGSYIDKALAEAAISPKPVVVEKEVRATIVSAPKYNIVIV